MMRSRAAPAAALILAAAGALAQTTTGAIAPAEPFAITEEDETALRRHVLRRPVERVAAAPADAIRPGAVIPRGVRLSPLADIAAPALARYAYFVSPDNRIVLVDPATRQVLRVISR